jgi:GNAT superfamily N-acetyltransferase
VSEDVSPTTRTRLGPIWVAKAWRRHGVATALVHAAAASADVAPDALAWSSPFTAAGLALAVGFSGPDKCLWIE